MLSKFFFIYFNMLGNAIFDIHTLSLIVVNLFKFHVIFSLTPAFTVIFIKNLIRHIFFFLLYCARFLCILHEFPSRYGYVHVLCFYKAFHTYIIVLVLIISFMILFAIFLFPVSEANYYGCFSVYSGRLLTVYFF